MLNVIRSIIALFIIVIASDFKNILILASIFILAYVHLGDSGISLGSRDTVFVLVLLSLV